jgi:superoxide reductase
MASLGEHLQQADWKKEKHAPVIQAPAQVSAGELFEVKVNIGQEIAHPNTTEHHISWISLYFHPQGAKFPHQLGHFEFSAHGESTAGANQGPAYTEPSVVTALKLNTSGTLYALALCNIHGLWESSQEIVVNA